MKIQNLINELEKWAPSAYAESFDNIGLLVGNKENEIKKVLVCLDCLEAVVDEAIAIGANVIVSFHPIIFKGLKKITGKNYVERVVIKAIKYDIAIYAIHTNLDNIWQGTNQHIAKKLGLKNTQILIPKTQEIEKITFYAPKNEAEKIKQNLYDVGVGEIGNYTECSFNFKGFGTYRGNQNSNPVVGEKGELCKEKERAVSMIYEKRLHNKVVTALKKDSFYEETAYEIVKLQNENQLIGMGIIGELEEPLSEVAFLKYVKKALPTDCIRHSELSNKTIKKVGLIGGSGSFGIHAAKAKDADAFVSADFKYHDFFIAENNILIADVGHYECEQFNKNLIADYIKEKFTTFAVATTDCNTNPINYFC